MQAVMRRLPFNRFVLSNRNSGLGANSNSALAAAKGEFVLQLQDDWECNGPSGFVEAGLSVMRERPEIAFIGFTDT